MKTGKLLIALLLLISYIGFYGCSTVNEATKLGNPPLELPTEPKAFTTEYLSSYPFWKGGAENGQGLAEDVWLIEFDTVNNK